jgi:hypothetical protein
VADKFNWLADRFLVIIALMTGCPPMGVGGTDAGKLVDSARPPSTTEPGVAGALPGISILPSFHRASHRAKQSQAVRLSVEMVTRAELNMSATSDQLLG